MIIMGVAVVAVVGLIAYYAHLRAQNRRDELSALAAEIGWRFSPTAVRSRDEMYAHLDIFRRGHSPKAYNTLMGSVEIDGAHCDGLMGDFKYKTTHTNSKGQTRTSTHRFSYLILDVPYAGVPDLLVRREGLFDKLAAIVGFDDIDFESAEFSRKFHVKSPDRKFAYAVITPEMMEFLLASDAPAVDIERGKCCMSNGRSKWQVPEFRQRLPWLIAFFDRWPEHVRADLVSRQSEWAS